MVKLPSQLASKLGYCALITTFTSTTLGDPSASAEVMITVPWFVPTPRVEISGVTSTVWPETPAVAESCSQLVEVADQLKGLESVVVVNDWGSGSG